MRRLHETAVGASPPSWRGGLGPEAGGAAGGAGGRAARVTKRGCGREAQVAATPHWFAFHGTPIELVFGTTFPYFDDQPNSCGCWKSGSVAMSFHNRPSTWL